MGKCLRRQTLRKQRVAGRGTSKGSLERAGGHVREASGLSGEAVTEACTHVLLSVCEEAEEQRDKLEMSTDVQAGNDGGLDSGRRQERRAHGQGWREARIHLPFCFPFTQPATGCGSVDFPWHCPAASDLLGVSPGPPP